MKGDDRREPLFDAAESKTPYMRESLIETFDKIYVLDLHGNAKKREVAADGSKDENAFDIQQGVAICVMVKNAKPKSRGTLQ